jgi:hypothetical protein
MGLLLAARASAPIAGFAGSRRVSDLHGLRAVLCLQIVRTAAARVVRSGVNTSVVANVRGFAVPVQGDERRQEPSSFEAYDLGQPVAAVSLR